MEGQANKETKRLRNKAKLLDEMYLWQCLGTGKAPADVAITDAQQKSMYNGERPPWDTDLSTAKTKERYHGRLVHAAKANLARCMEKEPILRVEKARLGRWIRHTTRCVHDAIAVHTNLDTQIGRGKIYLLQRYLARLAQMFQDVDNYLFGIPAPMMVA